MRDLNSCCLGYEEKYKLKRYYESSRSSKIAGIMFLIMGFLALFFNVYVGIFFFIVAPVCLLLSKYYEKIADGIFDNKKKAKEEMENRIKRNFVCITPELFTFEEAIKVMIGTNKTYCKSVYDYDKFFECAFACILNNISEHKIELSEKYKSRKKISEFPIERYKRLTSSTVINSLKDFIAIDTETTGLKPASDNIIELSAIKFENFVPKEVFHTYLKPSKSIPEDATRINHITDDMVENAPEFSQIINDLQKFIKGFHLVAYNAEFDMKFLHSSGLDLSKHKSKIYDVYAFAKKFEDYDDIENYKLSSVCAIHNIGDNKFHNANSDALACGLLFIDYIKDIKGIRNAFALTNPNEQADYDKAFYLKSYKGEKI